MANNPLKTIPELDEKTTVDADDLHIIYDDAGGIEKKVKDSTLDQNRIKTVQSIPNLPATVIAGQTLQVNGYHPGTTVGGGSFVGGTGRHNGGTFIDPLRPFPTPTEWANGSSDPAVIAWFADSGVDVDLWERLDYEEATPFMFGAYGNKSSDDIASLQAAADSGLTLHLEECAGYRITEELFIKTDGQVIYGDGGGILDADTFSPSIIGAKSLLWLDKDDSVTRYRMTRREAPASAVDPDDADLSCMVNIQAEGVQLRDFAIQSECDYTDTSYSNLGGDCDIAIMNGCRTATKIDGVTMLGYFRVAGIYLDVTSAREVLPQHSRPNGEQFSETYKGGSDQIHISRVQTFGTFKGLFLAGAKWGTGTYYDYISDTTYGAWGSRGGSGASDLLIDGDCIFSSVEHHSGRRYYDPTMNPATEDIDAMTACIALDGRRGSTDQGRIRRIRITDIRMVTGEAARIAIGRAYEVAVEWIHSEPDTKTTEDTAGNPIDVTDTSNYSYGPILCLPTGTGTAEAIARDGANEVRLQHIQGTGVVPDWSIFGVEQISNAKSFSQAVDFEFSIPDQDFVSFDVDKVFGAIVSVTTNSSGRSGIAFIRARPTETVRTIDSGSGLTFTTGALNGTTGTAGQLTVSGHDSKYYIENRSGATRTVYLSQIAG